MLKQSTVILIALHLAACTVLDPQHVVTRRYGNDAPPVGVAMELATRQQAFEFVWTRVRDAYVDLQLRGVDWVGVRERFLPIVMEASDDQTFWKNLDLMVAELGDAHTRVLSSRQFTYFKRKQSFSLGLSVAQLDGELIVTELASDSSAGAAGIKKGNKLLTIDGVPSAVWWQQELDRARPNSTARAQTTSVKRVLNSGNPVRPADQVALTVEDNGGRVAELQLTRTLLKKNDVLESKILPSGFAYLRLNGFDPSLREQIENAFLQIESTPGLVIDLRNNGGGSVSVAKALMDHLFSAEVRAGRHITRSGKPPSVLLGLLGSSANQRMDLLLGGSKSVFKAYRAPVVVLINSASASASELMAGALQALGRARVVGEVSCGCLLGYHGYATVPGGGALAYSEMDFEMLNGKHIEGVGVMPDRQILTTRTDLIVGRDAQLESAEALLRE